MSWYYNRVRGEVFEETGAMKWTTDREIDLEKAGAALGNPQIFYGPFPTQAQAQAFKAANPSVVDQAKTAAAGPVSDITTAIAAATNTAVKISIRLLEAAVGIVLLAVALNAILKQSTGIDVAGSAARAGRQAATVAAVA